MEKPLQSRYKGLITLSWKPMLSLWQLDLIEGAVYFLYEVEDAYCVFDASGNNQTNVPVDAVAHAPETSVAARAAQ